MNRRAFVPGLVLAATLSTSAARAADPIAERLYRDGRAAAQAKDWTKACAAFQESQNREPAPGTLLNLADCEEHRGRMVTAAAQYSTAARLFPAGDARAKFAAEKAATLEKRIAKLRIRTEASAAVEVDGAVLDAGLLAGDLSMDPGTHTIVVKAEGRADARSTVVLGEGETRSVDAKPGAPLPGAVAAAPASAAPAPAAPSAPPPTEPSVPPPAASWSTPSHDRPSKAPAYALFGVGGVALGVGAVTGVLALGAAKDVRSSCPNGECQTNKQLDAAQSNADTARSLALVSTIGVGVGVVAAAAGGYLFVRASSKTTVAPAVGTNSAGLVAAGTF